MNIFSTDQIPRQQRIAVLNDFVGRQVARREFRPLADEIDIDIAVVPLAKDVMVGQARYSPIAGRRTRELLNDTRDSYLLTVHDADCELAVEGREPVHVRAGDMMLLNESCLSEFRLPTVRVTVVSLNFREMQSRFPRIQSRQFHHVPAGAPGIALMTGYAGLLFQNPDAAQSMNGRAADHLHDIAAMAMGASSTLEAGYDRAGIGEARLAIIKREIDKRLRNPGVTIGAIAKLQGVTPRYVQQLFESEGTTFTDHLRARRLDLAHEMLASSTTGEPAGVSSIAYDCGFGDLSHFNRSFKKRFGMRPSDVRAAAMLKRDT